MNTFAWRPRMTAFAIGVMILSTTAAADDSKSQMKLPRIERGVLVSPMPTPSPNNDYPHIQNERLHVNKDVSLGGTISPPTVNVRVSMPEGKSKK